MSSDRKLVQTLWIVIAVVAVRGGHFAEEAWIHEIAEMRSSSHLHGGLS